MLHGVTAKARTMARDAIRLTGFDLADLRLVVGVLTIALLIGVLVVYAAFVAGAALSVFEAMA